jgi:DNA primase
MWRAHRRALPMPDRRPPLDLAALRDQVTPLRVLALHGWTPTRVEYATTRGPCPIHGSTTPRSRSLSVGSRSATCWSCGWHGDGIALHAELTGLHLLDAAYELCRILSIDPPLKRRA